jgi:3-deoxy-D-manno-octulosonic-acid transferase
VIHFIYKVMLNIIYIYIYIYIWGKKNFKIHMNHHIDETYKLIPFWDHIYYWRFFWS